MKIAWQTWVMIIIATTQFAIAQVLANVGALGLTDAPFLVLVFFPSVATLLTLAANQLKAIGGEPAEK